VLIYAGLPVVSQRNAHIAVDILDPITPKWIVPIRDFVVGILSAFALAVIAWRLWAYAMQIEGAGDVSEYLRLPLYPFAYFMAVLAGLAAIAEVWRTFCRHANSAAASPHTDTV
jgi:TRAP-type C4-dicarboxylate transport system permease small subunit